MSDDRQGDRPTHRLKSLFGTPPLPWLVHLHGFLMTSWFALFFVQVRLVAAHRVDLHRRLGVVGAALLLRRRRDYHKRLMLLSCLNLVGPGLSRIPLQHVPIVAFLRTGGPFGLFGLDLLLVYACIGYDTWRHRRLHPAFVFGALLIALEDLPFLGMFLSSPTWTHIATWFVS